MNLDILNADTGHTTITFDTTKPDEATLAETQINDMLKMGYAVFVEHDGKTKRVKKFDAKQGKYIVGARETVPDTAPATAVAPPSGGTIAR